MPLLKLYLHSETVVCRMLILIGLEMTYCSGEVDCHGPEGRTRGGGVWSSKDSDWKGLFVVYDLYDCLGRWNMQRLYILL